MGIELSSRARAGLLVVALALVGGTGCFTAVALTQASDNYSAHLEESRIERRIAQLSPQAQAGDAAAMTTLAYFLLRRGDRTLDDDNLAREVALLERAANAGFGQAQAVLGMALSGQGTFARVYRTLPSAMQDRPRAIAWLKKAATQACSINSDPELTQSYGKLFYAIDPALNASILLQRDGRTEEARLWFARSILHCGQTDVTLLRGWIAHEGGLTDAQVDSAMAPLYLLAGVGLYIDDIKARMTPEAFAAAERGAADLRRQVAASEREYPAPRMKELR